MTSVDEDLSIFNGKSFKTFAQFEEFLKKRSKAYDEKWAKGRGGRSVEVTNKQLVKKSSHYPKAFKYVIVNYKCVHGGTHVCNGKIRNRRSHKLGCEVMFRLLADKKKNALVVTRAYLQHNHGKNPPLAGKKPEKKRRTERRSGPPQKLVIVRKTEPTEYDSQTLLPDPTDNRSNGRPSETREKQHDSEEHKGEEEAGPEPEIDNDEEKQNHIKNILQAFVKKRKKTNSKLMSNLRKLECAKAVCTKLLNAMVSCPQEVFVSRLNALSAIAGKWGCGQDVGSIHTTSKPAEPVALDGKLPCQERAFSNLSGVSQTDRTLKDAQSNGDSSKFASGNCRISDAQPALNSLDLEPSTSTTRTTRKRTLEGGGVGGEEEEVRKSILPFVPKVKITGSDTGVEVSVMDRLENGQLLVTSQAYSIGPAL